MDAPRLQFGIRTLLEITFVAAVLLAFVYWRSAPRPDPASNRYELHVDPQDFETQVLLDTHTGDSWRRDQPSGSWFRVEPPIRKPPPPGS
jgi:hypothetical protein